MYDIRKIFFIVMLLNWIIKKKNYSGVFFYYFMDYFSRKLLFCFWEVKLNYGNCVEWIFNLNFRILNFLRKILVLGKKKRNDGMFIELNFKIEI